MKAKKKVEVVTEPLRLDLGSGPNTKEGFVGVDVLDFGQDLVADLRQPWPWEDNSVAEVHSSHFLEHLDADERIHFFNELYRVLEPGAKVFIIVPHWASGRAYGDLTHKWPPVVEFFWFYLNAGWRAVNAPHLPLACHFDAQWGYSVNQVWQTRNQEMQQFGLTHYREVADDMIATLTKCEMPE